MIKLPRSISRTEFKERLRLADQKTLKKLAKNFSHAALVHVNPEQGNQDLRKTLESIYFRDRELSNKNSFINSNKYYTYDSLISCPFTERQNVFELYRYLYDNTTPGKKNKRSTIYDLCNKFYEDKSKKFNKQIIYTLTRLIVADQKDLDIPIIKSNKTTITFNRIYTWKDKHPIMEE